MEPSCDVIMADVDDDVTTTPTTLTTLEFQDLRGQKWSHLVQIDINGLST